MKYKVGYLYHVNGHDIWDTWETVVLLEEITEKNYSFLELEIIWNNKKEEAGGIWTPEIKFLEVHANETHDITEIGPAKDHPEYLL